MAVVDIWNIGVPEITSGLFLYFFTVMIYLWSFQVIAAWDSTLLYTEILADCNITLFKNYICTSFCLAE